MKIAVYGDSFGNCNLTNIPGDNIDRGKSWVEELEKIYTVTNFSMAASSLFYSYELFLKHNKDFDYNIFLVTEPNRLTLTGVDNDYHLKHINLSISDFILKKSETSNDNRDLPIMNAVLGYYTYIHNQNQIDICHRLIVDSITGINKNSLIIPCFAISVPGKLLYRRSLVDISDNELPSLKLLNQKGYKPWELINDSWTFTDYRKCHLSEENNKILADIIDSNIINKETFLDININDFKQSINSVEFYYLKKEIINGIILDSRFNGELNKLLIDTN
jgi:hypothetical protein